MNCRLVLLRLAQAHPRNVDSIVRQREFHVGLARLVQGSLVLLHGRCLTCAQKGEILLPMVWLVKEAKGGELGRTLDRN
jgi:hypothetical protein